jgi:monofunctional biosynthetic peptidoglycan transglycosylase
MPTHDMPMVSENGPVKRRPVVVRALVWAKNHKFRTVLLLIALYLCIEALSIPYFTIWSLHRQQPGVTALMRQRIGEAEQSGKPYRIRQTWVPLSSVPHHVRNAIIVAEDGTFFTHGGVDWFEVQESLKRNLETGRTVRGASTITQQLAKNLYLSTSKSWMRKGKELLITVLLEWRLSKARILELYLNVIEWGDGVYGIEAASRAYFNKPASALTLDEGTRLAAVIPSPLRYRPDEDSRYVLRRQRTIMRWMAARKSMATSTTEETSSRAPEPFLTAGTPEVPDDTSTVDSSEYEEDYDEPELQRR